MNKVIEYSIILPCYNEAENLKQLIENFSKFLDGYSAELIIVDNGSTDNTPNFKDEMLIRFPFLKWITIKDNIGYGNGIYTGLKLAQGLYIGYTHADLQADPYDVKIVMDMIQLEPNKRSKLFKGTRVKRRFIERLFSWGMELIVKLILKQSLSEINAQPNIFTRDLFLELKNPPLDWGFDLYLYHIADKFRFDITRICVNFTKRKAGKSKWKNGFFPRVKLSYKMMKYCFQLKSQI